MTVGRGALEGRRVLVTGAGTGIGREVARQCAREGAAVVLHYFNEEEGVKEALDEIVSWGSKAALVQGDFREIDDVKRCAAAAEEFLGGIDVLVNNSGITLNVPFDDVTTAQFDTLFAVNVRAMFFLTQALVPALARTGRGAVVNLSSIHALGGRVDYSVYAATKGAIVSLTRQLAIELAPSRIRVNVICPGAIEVENYYQAVPGFRAEEFGPLIPAGRVGRTGDIAKAAMFLASDDARYITGQTLVVDGGVTAWFAFSEQFKERSKGMWGRQYVQDRQTED
jgi:NAD(P)-dependent dehydrogenase (short-subunit alcohol dehydrogenase family)